MKYLFDKGSNVKFEGNMVPLFLNSLVKKVKKYGIKVYVTSGYRSPYDQARVVCNNFHNTNAENLSIYGSKTQQMYRDYCPQRDLETLEKFEREQLEARLKKDPNYQGHATGYAVDLSVYGMSNDEKILYKEIIEKMGAKVLWEKSPEHFHVWLKSWYPKGRLIGLFSFSVGLFYLYKYLDKK